MNSIGITLSYGRIFTNDYVTNWFYINP